MVNIPDFSINLEQERHNMENQARQLVADLNDFILGAENAHITRLAVEMFQSSLARYEHDFETPVGKAPAEKELTEKLADQAHASWSHWMQYLFAQSKKQADGSVVIPGNLVARWDRQMNTPYSQLAEQEKQSDREQATALLPIINEAVNG